MKRSRAAAKDATTMTTTTRTTEGSEKRRKTTEEEEEEGKKKTTGKQRAPREPGHILLRLSTLEACCEVFEKAMENPIVTAELPTAETLWTPAPRLGTEEESKKLYWRHLDNRPRGRGALPYWIWKEALQKTDSTGATQYCWWPSQQRLNLVQKAGGREFYTYALLYRCAMLLKSDPPAGADLEAKLRTQMVGNATDNQQVTHTCGMGWCCNPDHLELQTKAYNDEQRHCHFFLNVQAYRKGSRAEREASRRAFFALDACPHRPRCF